MAVETEEVQSVVLPGTDESPFADPGVGEGALQHFIEDFADIRYHGDLSLGAKPAGHTVHGFHIPGDSHEIQVERLHDQRRIRLIPVIGRNAAGDGPQVPYFTLDDVQTAVQ